MNGGAKSNIIHLQVQTSQYGYEEVLAQRHIRKAFGWQGVIAIYVESQYSSWSLSQMSQWFSAVVEGIKRIVKLLSESNLSVVKAYQEVDSSKESCITLICCRELYISHENVFEDWVLFTVCIAWCNFANLTKAEVDDGLHRTIDWAQDMTYCTK